MAARTIRVNLSADATNFTQNIRNASRSVSSLGSELNANVKRIRTETKLLQESLGNTATDVQKVGLSFQGLSRVLQQQSQYTRRVQTDLDALRTTSNATSIEVRKLEQRLLSAALAEQTTANALGRLKNELAGLRSTDSLQKISHAMDLAAVASQKMVASLGPAASGTSLYQAKITGLNKELQISIRLQRELAAAFTRSATTYGLTNDKTKAIRLQMSQASLATQNFRNNIKQLQGQMGMVSANNELQRTSFLMQSASINSQKMTANLRSGASAIDRNRAALEGLNRELTASRDLERALRGSVVSASAQFGVNSQESRALQTQLNQQGLLTTILAGRVLAGNETARMLPSQLRIESASAGEQSAAARGRSRLAQLGYDPDKLDVARTQLRNYNSEIVNSERLQSAAVARTNLLSAVRGRDNTALRESINVLRNATTRTTELGNARQGLRDTIRVMEAQTFYPGMVESADALRRRNDLLNQSFANGRMPIEERRRSLRLLQLEERQLTTGMVNMREAIRTANRSLGSQSEVAREMRSQYQGLESRLNGLRTNIDSTARSMTLYNRIASAMTSPAVLTAGIGLSTAVSYPSYQLIKQGMLYNSVIENNTVAFKTMFGSLEKAQNMIKDVQSFAVVTPFRTSEIADQVRALTQFGVAAENALPIAKMLGDISLGDPLKFGILAYNYAQATSLGRLQARDAYSMNLAGFNPKTAIEAYRESQGKKKGNIDKEMEEGAVSIVELTEAMIYATSAGQKFHDGMLNASKTVSGQWSTLRDNIDITLGTMTKGMFEFVRTSVLPMLIGLTSWITKFAELNPKTTAAVTTMVLLGAAIGPVLIGIYGIGQALVYMNLGWTALKGIGLIKWFSNLAYAFRIMRINAVIAGTSVASAGLAAAGAWLLAAAEVVAIIAAVVLLAYGVRLVIANWEKVKDYFNALRIFMGSTFGTIGAYIVKAFYDGMKIAGGFFDYVKSAIANFSKGKFTGWEVEQSAFTLNAVTNSVLSGLTIDEEVKNLDKAANNMFAAYDSMTKSFGDTLKSDWEAIKKLLPDFTFEIDPPELKVPPIDLGKIKDGTKAGEAGEDALKKLEQKIESMVDKIKDQAKAFRDALGLFDKAVTEKISGEKLMLRLRSQFKIFESWSASIATLKARLGAGSPMFQDLLAKGPAYAGPVDAIARMNDLQFGMYEKMYQDKSNLAAGPAGLLVGLQAVEESKLERIKQVVININGGVVVGNEAQLVDTVTKELKRQGVF